MSVAERWARTPQQVELMHATRRHGGRCAWCGRGLDDGELVYVDAFKIGERRLRRDGPAIHRTAAHAPVGAECASPELLDETAGQAPETCAGCGRGVYYRSSRGDRRRAVCSRRCLGRATSRRA